MRLQHRDPPVAPSMLSVKPLSQAPGLLPKTTPAPPAGIRFC